MVPLHTVYVITLVSQTTSALVLSLLAWADRRSRWLVPLAVACALHAAGIYLQPMWRGTGRWLPQAFSASILVLMLTLVHAGLQSLAVPGARRSTRTNLAVGATMILLFALASVSSIWCLEATEVVAVLLLMQIVLMLRKAPARELRKPLWATAALLFLLALHFLIRIPLETLQPASSLLLFLRESTMLLITSMAFAFLALFAQETRRRLHEESRLDVLTGLLNRRAMEEYASEQVKLAERQQKPCALLMLDLDHFKRLNDTWGHDVGDQALLATGELLLLETQAFEQCHVARMGGEEFALLLPGATVDTAYTLAKGLCQKLAALRIWVDEQEIRITASVGLSTLQAGESTWIEMLRRADRAMYQAKQAGRNRVMVCAKIARDVLAASVDKDVAAPFV